MFKMIDKNLEDDNEFPDTLHGHVLLEKVISDDGSVAGYITTTYEEIKEVKIRSNNDGLKQEYETRFPGLLNEVPDQKPDLPKYTPKPRLKSPPHNVVTPKALRNPDSDNNGSTLMIKTRGN